MPILCLGVSSSSERSDDWLGHYVSSTCFYLKEGRVGLILQSLISVFLATRDVEVKDKV